jgi:hypothetical protein
LLYIARIYQKITDNKQLYSNRKMSIPRPVFIVLYNGKENFPARTELKLSDMFKKIEGHERIALEVEVTVYNINKGINPEIEERSPTLSGYAELVGKVRENQAAGLGGDEAVRGAVNFCIERGIIAGFLKEHVSEVENMLLTEWNWDDALQVRWEEGIEKGLDKGREESRKLFYKLMDQVGSVDELRSLLETSPLKQQNSSAGTA